MDENVLITLAVVFLLTPFAIIFGIPEPEIYSVLETSLLLRIGLLHGFSMGVFFIGLASNSEGAPLLFEVGSFAISILWLEATWSELMSYTHIPEASLGPWWLPIWFFGSVLSFVGTAFLLKRVARELVS